MSAWQELVTASLIGTERTAVPPAPVPGLPAAPDAPDDPAAELLDRAALLTVARRGGRPPERVEPLPAAEPDLAPPVSPAAGRRLARMLGGEHPDLLTEWLKAAVAHGRLVPAHLLPPLLDRARRVLPADTGLPRLAAEAGGRRARWLAALNPDWNFVAAHTLAGDDAWRLGDAGQRRAYLAALRARDPDAARELVAASWDAAGPDRVMFLSVLADESPGSKGLSLADEPLLEAALDDRAAEVRGWAAYLLARLPGSALGRRMAGRALGCLRLHLGVRGTRLIITPPTGCDAAMRRDGIAPGPAASGSQLASQAHLMLEILARTPLCTWTGEFGRPAGQIVAVPSGDWAPVLFTGWARAAMAQRDQEWMAALINWAIAGGLPGHPSGAETLRKLVRRVDPALGAPGITASFLAALPPTSRDAITVLRFRYDMLKELDDDDSAG
jgi:hypothetical protein